MSRRTKQPIVRDGIPAPHLDHRWVPSSTMAVYEDCHPMTVYRRALAGHYPATGLHKFGSEIRYRPSVCLPLPAEAQS